MVDVELAGTIEWVNAKFQIQDDIPLDQQNLKQ